MPTLLLTRLSSSSFTATVGSTSGAAVQVYYQRQDGATLGSLEGPLTRTGDGDVTASGLRTNSHYMVYAVTGSGSYSLPAIAYISLSVSDSVLSAVRRRWNSIPSLLSSAGPLYANEVPERDPSGNPIDLPYTVASIGRSNFDWTFEAEYLESHTLDFNVYVKGAAAAEAAEELIRSSFDYQALPYIDTDEIQTIVVRPLESYMVCENVRNKDGHMVWRTEACYQVMNQRSLARKPSSSQFVPPL